MFSHNCLNYPSIFEDHALDRGNDINCKFSHHCRKCLYNNGNTDNHKVTGQLNKAQPIHIRLIHMDSLCPRYCPNSNLQA